MDSFKVEKAPEPEDVYWENFIYTEKNRIFRFKKKLINFKEKGYKICGYAAAAKSTTLLNYCNIDNNFILYII